MLTLRPYQQTVVDDLISSIKSNATHPILVNASVGSGKSLIISELLLWLQRNGFTALCLTLNSSLIQQNANTYKLQQGKCGIYCAGLNSKETEQLIIFASPHSICQDIRHKGKISGKPFNVIVIDEVHNVSPHDPDSMYMRIINHYGLMAQSEQYMYRIIGLTGTPYRGKSVSIVGESELFKEQICSISTSFLIKEGFLVKPSFGLITEEFDFSKVKVNSFGKFNNQDLQDVVDRNKRLTSKIMREIVMVVSSGKSGAFIFASTIKHCYECLASLPAHESAIIIGITPHLERERIIRDARGGKIKYLVNVNCLTVGIDVPNFDVCAWLRPTESLILYTQGIGRVLRLSPGKTSSVVLDYAQNLDRHGDVDDPIINEAIQPKESDDPDYCIPCYTCGTNNTIHARRCIGITPKGRCDYFFDFKPCHKCMAQNDTTSRYCRLCEAELIDPNSKLRLLSNQVIANVQQINYQITSQLFSLQYQTDYGLVTETYHLTSQRSLNIFYANFVRKQVDKPSSYYMHLRNPERLEVMLKYTKMPTKLLLEVPDLNIKNKIY